jgi:AcrR family transcriptional regulator
MATVAADVGMARQTLYTFVAGRRELIELVLIERSKELVAAATAKSAGSSGEMPEALVEFMAVMVELTKADREFGQLAGALSREDAFPFLTGPSPLRALVLEGLRPLFDRAAAEGLLRERPYVEMAGWVQNVLVPLAARTDLDPATLRSTLRDYTLPALVITPV